MTATVMYIVDADGDVVHFEQFKNSHGGASAVWSLLCAHYLGVEPFGYLDDGVLTRLFALAEDPSSAMALDDRIVLLTTDEHVMVRSVDVPRLADVFERFYAKWLPKRTGMVFSIGAQAAAMRRAIGDPDVQGICWNQNTVGEAWNEPFTTRTAVDDDGASGDGIPDEDADEDDCEWGYNINVHTKHSWLFDHPVLKALDAQPVAPEGGG